MFKAVLAIPEGPKISKLPLSKVLKLIVYPKSKAV